MPAVRDYAFNYTTSTTGTTIAVPMPSYAQNDLLVALLTQDTGTPTWSGVSQLNGAASEDFGASAVADTTDANDTDANDMEFVPVAPAVNDAYYYGSENTFSLLRVNIGTAGVATWTIVWEYYNGSSWTTLPGISDGTTGYTAAAGNRDVTFNVPTDWATTTVASLNLYWIRSRVSAFTSLTTRPLGTQAWVRDWTQLFSSTNTVNLSIAYKIATSSEAADITFTTSSGETLNGAIISIRDVDTSTPFSEAAYATQSTGTSTTSLYSGSVTRVGQSFTGTGGVMSRIRLSLKKTGSPTGNAKVVLYAHSGTYGTSSVATGNPLATSDLFDVSILTTSLADVNFVFSKANQYTLVNATNYFFSLEYSGGDVSNNIQIAYVTPSAYGGNYASYSGSWTANSSNDVNFIAYIFTSANSNTSASKANLPTMTTSRNNSLLLYSCANSSAAVPSILEGACQLIFAKDGSAHSDGASWGFQATAGTTPSNIGYSSMSASASKLAVVGINPPSTGATVIPGYCASDSSVYVSPFTGAAFNSDSVPANTITTPFTGTINGKTLAAGGSTVTRADTGLNSYHAMNNFTGIATSGQWAGTRTTMVARTTLAGKNILFHLQPYLPVDIQTTDSVALLGTMGVAIGLASTAGNFKVWHVGGASTSWGTARHVPVVVNTSNTTGVIQSTGSFNSASITEIGLMVSGKVVAPNWLAGSVWGLDTTTITGGNSTEPLEIDGIILAAADGHERRSVIKQGSSEMLVLQPLQIGDGGTNPVYLDLNATATEFPRLYNKTLKEVYYCSIDNYAGIKYYPGSSDTIKHRNSVITSASRFFWGLHASASTSATYDFTATSVIGAGTITLNRAVTISELTINDYSTLDVSGATMSSCNITNVPNTNDSITTSSTTVFTNSSISTTTLTTPGSRWVSLATADLDMFSGCTFTGITTGGHAIRLTSTGTVSFTGNTFTGYGPSARSFNASTGVNTTTNIITLDAAHGYSNGEPCYFQDQGGAAPTGMVDGTLYYVRSESSTSISLYTSAAQAIAGGSPGQVDITATGSGTQYIYSAAAAIYNNSGGAVTINVTNGTSPSIRNSDGSSTTVNNNITVTVTIKDTAGAAIPGVEVAIFQDNAARTVVLASTATNGSGEVSTSAAASLGAIIIRARQSTNKATFNTGTGVVTGTDVITTDANHKFQTGDRVTYSRNGGSVDIGPEPGTYYVNRITDSTLYLYDTAANAITGGGTGRQDLTSSGSETHHLDPIRYVPASATGTIGVGAFSAQITMITDDIATG